MSEEIPDEAVAEVVQHGYAKLPDGGLLMGMPLSDVTDLDDEAGCREPHPADFRCFDCATDEELAASIPPFPATEHFAGEPYDAKPFAGQPYDQQPRTAGL